MDGMAKKAETSEVPVPSDNDSHQTSTQEASLGTTLGRQTKVRRLFSYLQLFFFALTYMSSWEAMVSNLTTVFYNGGPRALSWGIVIVFAGALAQSASLAEMAAMQPIAGAQYHWTSALAPPKHRRLITWLQGWMTWFAWISTLAGVSNFTAYVIQGIAINNYPNYVPHPWHLTLIIIAMLLVQTSMTSFTFWLIPWIELLAGFLHIALFIIFLVVLLATTKNKQTAEFVFTSSSAASGWTNSFVSWNVGLLTPTWGFVGFDAAVHVSEEVRKSKYAVPRAMFWSIAINGVLAYAMILTILFCVGDFESVLSSPYPMFTIILNSTGSLGGTTAMCCGLALISLSANLGTIVSVSRLTWAWARDGALPRYFSFISPSYRVPIRASWLPVFITMLLSLLNIASTAAFGAILALASMGLFCSYIIAICCMIYARFSSDKIELGGWNLGRWGLPINIFAVVYSCYIFVFLPFPTSLPVTGTTMNYALPLFAFTVLFATSTWVVWGRKQWPGLNEKVLELVLADSDRNTKD